RPSPSLGQSRFRSDRNFGFAEATHRSSSRSRRDRRGRLRATDPRADRRPTMSFGLMANLRARYGLRFVERPPPQARRPGARAGPDTENDVSHLRRVAVAPGLVTDSWLETAMVGGAHASMSRGWLSSPNGAVCPGFYFFPLRDLGVCDFELAPWGPGGVWKP